GIAQRENSSRSAAVTLVFHRTEELIGVSVGELRVPCKSVFSHDHGNRTADARPSLRSAEVATKLAIDGVPVTRGDKDEARDVLQVRFLLILCIHGKAKHSEQHYRDSHGKQMFQTPSMRASSP